MTQYVYNGSLLTEEDIAIIYQNIRQIPFTGEYVDAFKDTDKKAEIQNLVSRYQTPPDDSNNRQIDSSNNRRVNRRKRRKGDRMDIINNYDMMISDIIQNNNSSYITDRLTESKTHRYMKNRIKLNESTLKQIIGESIRKVLREGEYMSYEDTDAYREEEREVRETQRRNNLLKNACDKLLNTFYNYAEEEDCDYFLDYIRERIKIRYSALGFNGAD